MKQGALSDCISPICWGNMFCHNSCHQTEVHDSRKMEGWASWSMIPESVYHVQKIFSGWDAGRKHRNGSFSAFGKGYASEGEARDACMLHKFQQMVNDIAEMI